MEAKWFRWIAITAIAPIAWGSTYFVTRHLLPPDAALWGAVIRSLPAGILVLLIMRRLPTGSWWWKSLVTGTLTVGGLNVLVYIAAQRLDSSLAATLMSTSAAALMLMSWMLLKQRPRLVAAGGAALGMLGVVVMMEPSTGRVDVWGVVASIGAMLASSLGFVLTARWGKDVPPLTMAGWQLVAGSLVVVPVAVIVEGAPPALDGGAILGFAYIIVIATAVAYAAWFTGLRRLPGAAVGMVGLLNPVTGVLLGVALAGERFGMPQATGILLVIAGVLLGLVRPPAAGRRAAGRRAELHGSAAPRPRIGRFAGAAARIRGVSPAKARGPVPNS
ncbi:EamA family transporter [Microbacterium awajiense]|uniref:EamA family transporter n=1 Tax=Microbacterium awajiense TaxID=415214 RepID=A0ABP7AR30_9MICO